MKVKLYLHGHLRNKVQKDFVEVDGDTLLDALKNFELRYRKVLKAPLDIGKWRIRVKDFDTRESWIVPLFVDEVHVYPEFRMGKSNKTSGIIQTVIGATLITAGAVYGTFTGDWATASIMISTGISFLAQGVLTLFFAPTNETDNSNSKYLGAGQNTTKSGTRIAIGYGLFKVAGQVLSYNISSSNIRIYGE